MSRPSSDLTGSCRVKGQRFNRPVGPEHQVHLLATARVREEVNLLLLVVIVHYVEDDSWYLLHFGQLPTRVLIVAQVFLVSY